jgi:uncharacterized LabA/DUF88 family protein
VYIDGFNFYYGAIKDTAHKWLNLEEFCRRLRKDDNIQAIRYFTSIVSGPSQSRQYAFIGALNTLRPVVTVIIGKFKDKPIPCTHSACTFEGDRFFTRPEEKRTDVGIAVHMLDDAYQDRCDRFILISGDSDLVPAVKMIRQRFQHKKVIVYSPTRDGVDERHASELRQAASDGRNLPTDFLEHCHFPDVVTDKNGATYRKPKSWC